MRMHTYTHTCITYSCIHALTHALAYMPMSIFTELLHKPSTFHTLYTCLCQRQKQSKDRKKEQTTNKQYIFRPEPFHQLAQMRRSREEISAPSIVEVRPARGWHDPLAFRIEVRSSGRVRTSVSRGGDITHHLPLIHHARGTSLTVVYTQGDTQLPALHS